MVPNPIKLITLAYAATAIAVGATALLAGWPLWLAALAIWIGGAVVALAIAASPALAAALGIGPDRAARDAAAWRRDLARDREEALAMLADPSGWALPDLGMPQETARRAWPSAVAAVAAGEAGGGHRDGGQTGTAGRSRSEAGDGPLGGSAGGTHEARLSQTG